MGGAPSEHFLLLPMTVRGLQVKVGSEMWEWDAMFFTLPKFCLQELENLIYVGLKSELSE